MEFDSRIKEALMKMNFVERYEKLGYVPKFDPKEKFFKTKDEKIGNFSFRVHIILRYGIADFLWVVSEGKNLIWGYPFSMCPSILISPEHMISKPVFGTYEDLDEILKITFEMYEDFKIALTEN